MTCVCLLVRLEDARGHEATAAELALVGLLPRVGPHVLLQVAGLLKAFVAVLTPVNTAGRAESRSFGAHSDPRPETEEKQSSPVTVKQRGQLLQKLLHEVKFCSEALWSYTYFIL